jgi:hypothetical protein
LISDPSMVASETASFTGCNIKLYYAAADLSSSKRLINRKYRGWLGCAIFWKPF